jgi:hypothetical protein
MRLLRGFGLLAVQFARPFIAFGKFILPVVNPASLTVVFIVVVLWANSFTPKNCGKPECSAGGDCRCDFYADVECKCVKGKQCEPACKCR